MHTRTRGGTQAARRHRAAIEAELAAAQAEREALESALGALSDEQIPRLFAVLEACVPEAFGEVETTGKLELDVSV